MEKFNGMKVFSATLARNREELGNKVTQWMEDNPSYTISNLRVAQSSDREFHCISLVVFYDEAGL